MCTYALTYLESLEEIPWGQRQVRKDKEERGEKGEGGRGGGEIRDEEWIVVIYKLSNVWGYQK